MQNASIFRRVFEQAGLPSHVIDGIIANFVFESGGGDDIDTTNTTGDGGTAWGAAQWRLERREGLLEMARERGTDWTDPETQALYTLYELQTGAGGNDGVLDQLMATSSAEEATRIFMSEYERPGTPHFDGRLDKLALVTGQASAPTGGSATPTTGVLQGPGQIITAGIQIGGEDDLRGRFENWRAAMARGEAPLLERIKARIIARRGGETPFLDTLIERVGGWNQQRFERRDQLRELLGGSDRPTVGAGADQAPPLQTQGVGVGPGPSNPLPAPVTPAVITRPTTGSYQPSRSNPQTIAGDAPSTVPGGRTLRSVPGEINRPPTAAILRDQLGHPELPKMTNASQLANLDRPRTAASLMSQLGVELPSAAPSPPPQPAEQSIVPRMDWLNKFGGEKAGAEALLQLLTRF